jgi:Flp pilus assembly pilin Flp
VLRDLTLRLLVLMHRERERGQTMAEYAVVLAVISIGIVVALTSLRGAVSSAFTKVTADI